MKRKTPLPRYRAQNLSRKEIVEGAWKGTHPDFRGSNHTVMWQNGLVPVSALPDDELISRYVSYERKSLQARARAQDLSLYEQNPDDPGSSILFADSEILFRTRGGWNVAYMQPANFDEQQAHKASKYAQVVAALNPDAPSDRLVEILRSPESYSEWKRLEKSGAVRRDEEGNVSIVA